jgi:glycosyltransferase involved in cell wall biosynthesis
VRSDDERAFLEEVRALGAGAPVQLLANVSHEDMRGLYRRARIFWHAAGLGHDEATHPEQSEHFGAVTVEAMAAGCVPVVIRRGGQPEIVEHGVTGFLWDTPEELEACTLALVNDEGLRERMATAARRRARAFSREAFCRGVIDRAWRHL